MLSWSWNMFLKCLSKSESKIMNWGKSNFGMFWNVEVKFWEYPRGNSQQNWSGRAKREFRKVLQKIQGGNVELPLRQVLRSCFKFSGVERLNCSWKVLGRYETSFEAKKVKWSQDEFLQGPIIFSKQFCWLASPTSFENVLDYFQSKIVGMLLWQVFEKS